MSNPTPDLRQLGAGPFGSVESRRRAELNVEAQFRSTANDRKGARSIENAVEGHPTAA